jgi:hypothetical protein
MPLKFVTYFFEAFQEDPQTLSTVGEWIRAFKTGCTSVLDDARAGRPRRYHIDSRILSLFTKNEFHSARPLAEELSISLCRVHDKLVNVLGFSL